MAVAHRDILFRQILGELRAFLRAHDFQDAKQPFPRVLIQGELVLPLGVEQVFVALRQVRRLQPLGVVLEDVGRAVQAVQPAFLIDELVG